MATVRETIQLSAISCTDCYWKIESKLKQRPGFVSMSYDNFRQTITVEYDPVKLNRLMIEAIIESEGGRIRGKRYPGLWESLRQAFSRGAARRGG